MQYEIDKADMLTRIDDEWDGFAEENQAPKLNRASVIGSSLWTYVVGEESRQLYQLVFRQVRRLQEPASIPFRCDSPRKRRFLRLQIDPLPDSGLRLTSLTERIESRPPVNLLDPKHARSDDILTICGWCKKVLLPDQNWVEAEEAINSLRLFDEILPQMSHGICPDCSENFIRELR